MGRAILAISGSASALLPRPFDIIGNCVRRLLARTDPRRGPPLPARTALHARPRPGLARQVRRPCTPPAGLTPPYLFGLPGPNCRRPDAPGAIKEFERMVRAAILDDYQNVALKFADWSPIAKDVEIKVFNKPFAGQDEAIKALQGFADRRRHARAHAVPAQGDRGAARPQAPDHHRRPQQFLRRQGLRRARRHRLRHRRRRQPDHRHRLRPDAGTDPPHRLRERAAEGRRALADHDRPAISKA